jgi:TatD DNase family protein
VIELFDTHAHLHFPEFAADLGPVLERARAAGVRQLVTIGTNLETSRAAVDLASRDPDIFAAVGVHPHDAADADDAALGELERLARSSPKVVAIGETGLDFFRNLAPRPAQERAFRGQLELARRLGKPVLVHCRDAHPEALAMLAEADLSGTGGIMHCFSGDATVARRVLDLGLVISIAGPITYPNARALPEVVRLTPPDRLVVETDCPFLPPQGHRGQRNEPALIALTIGRVAALRGEPLEATAARTTATARQVFGLA